MKHIIVLLSLILAVGNCFAAGLAFEGQSSTAVEISPASSTGLDKVYVLQSAQGVKASYTSSTGSVTWMRYSNLGGGYAEEISSAMSGNVSSITLPDEDYGYIIEDGTTRYYFWITNYANHQLALNAITFDSDQDCDMAHLVLDGDAGAINYYSITGVRQTISRELTLGYNTLEYDESTEAYVSKYVETQLASVSGNFSCTAPYCDTEFTLSGDRFLRAWGNAISVTSDTYKTIAVDAHTSAVQAEREYANEQSQDADTSFGGSGPVIVTFSAAVTDAAIFTEWELSHDEEFESVYDRYQQLDFSFSFRDAGTSYVRFVAANADATCEYYGEVYSIYVGESVLLCPNAFSPGASEGVNDEWRVSYKSIIDFDCHIFNRWGQEMCHLTHPSQGWDGKYKGKLVPTGAYYYVIKATGTDGRKYNLSGDINIIRYKTSTTTSSD